MHLSFNPYTISTVNHDARLERHHKLFGKTRTRFARWRQLRARREVHASNARHRFADPLGGFSPSQRLFQRIAATGFVFLLINSVNFANASYDVGGIYVNGYDDLSVDSNLSLVSDDEGYLTKAMPLEGEARYLNRGKEFVTHQVQSGDTLSVIAYRYDLSMETILWANPGLGSGNFLKIGQEIKIPPADGIKVKVESGDSWDSLIKEYKSELSQEEIIAWNSADAPVEGTEVFILGGRNPQPTYVATTDNRDYSTRSDSRGEIPTDVVVVPVGDGTWVRPTSGSLTQGYHWGHYAYDIADRSKPPVVAVADGTVIKAEYGWGGGYGNHIIIDHGNGYQTLYGHNEELYVSVGDTVTQGQVISKMGNTGRVYGATGIHLHFELIYNGQKINPAPVFGW